MSDPSTNQVLEKIASNVGGGSTAQPRKEIDILQEIAENTEDLGSDTPAYDDTALKQRVTSVEDKNTQQDLALNNVAESIVAVAKRVTAGELFHSSLIVPWADSRGAQNWNSNTVPLGVLARSPLWHMEMLSQRVRVNADYMQAVSGDDLDQLYARMTGDVVGQYGKYKPSEVPPCIAWVQIGTNSVNKGVPLATMLAKLNLILDWLIDHGHKVLLLAEWPRGAAGVTDSQLSADNQKLLIAYHNAILKIRRKDVFIVDVWPRVVDPTSAVGYPLANMLNPDTLHNSPGVAMITAQEATRVIIEEMKLPRQKITTSSNADLFDAVIQPQGCLNTNPMLITPGGTLGANATGVVPLGYTLSASAGLAVVGSFVTTTLPDGSKRPAFRIAVSGTPTSTNGYASLRQSGILSKVSVNDILEFNHEIVVADGHVNFSAPGSMIDTGLAATRAHGGLSLTGDNMAPASAVKGFYGVARSPDLAIGATLPASISLELRPYFTLANVASSLTMDILSTGLRKKKQ